MRELGGALNLRIARLRPAEADVVTNRGGKHERPQTRLRRAAAPATRSAAAAARLLGADLRSRIAALPRPMLVTARPRPPTAGRGQRRQTPHRVRTVIVAPRSCGL